MTTSPFDSYRPPEDGRRRKRRSSGVRGAVTGAAKDLATLRGSSVAPQEPGGQRSWLSRDGGGRREAPAVPDAEFSSYYGQSIVKPVPWDHKISAYLFVGGIAGTSGIIQAGAAATGNTVLQRNARLTAMTTVALSGAALVADLGRPERFLNMMRTVKLTSPMSVGTWILTAYAGFATVTTGSEVLRLLPSRGPLTALARVTDALDTPSTIGQAAFGAPLAAYTAVLLADTAHPVWHESRRQLPFVFVGSAALASGGVQMILTPTASASPARRLALLGVATDLAAMHQLEQHLADLGIDEPITTGQGAGKLRLAKGLVIAGGVGTLLAGRSRLLSIASGAALAAASALTRMGIVEAGIESAKDPKYTVRVQKDRLEKRRQQGQVDDSIVTVR